MVFWHYLPLNFTGWRHVEVRYDQFLPFDRPVPEIERPPLTEIIGIEFAINSVQPAAGNEVRLRQIAYEDPSAPRLSPVDGFAAFQSEQNWLSVEITAQMAAAYCAAGRTDQWTRYMSEQTNLLPSGATGVPAGLPNVLTGGVNRPVPEAVASSWYVIAARCLNPFAPE
jgi:hypothetical protein